MHDCPVAALGWASLGAQGAQGGADALGALWSVALITALLLAVTLLMSLTQPRRHERKRRTIVEVRCTQCSHREEREFSKGDYVGKIVGTCPKCGAHLTVDAIYSREEAVEEKLKHRGKLNKTPLIPFRTGPTRP